MNRCNEATLRERVMNNTIERARQSVRLGMRSVSILALVLLLGGLSASVVAGEEAFGRLFFSPEDRAVLQLQRESASVAAVSRVAEEVDKQEDAEPPPRVFSLGGTVTGRDGVRAVWLNGQRYTEDGLPANVQVVKPYTVGQVVFRNEETGELYRLHPGQTLDLNEGRVRELYERQSSPATVTGRETGEIEIGEGQGPAQGGNGEN